MNGEPIFIMFYRIAYNTFWKTWQVTTDNDFVCECDTLKQAVEHCMNGHIR